MLEKEEKADVFKSETKLSEGKESSDNLNSKGASAEATESRDSKKETEDLRKRILEELSEDEIRELLEAKSVIEIKDREIEDLKSMVSEYAELLKRKQADFENFRKRLQRESEEQKKFANIELVRDILEVIDNLERAIESSKSSKDLDSLLEGIMMIEKQFKNLLERKYNVKMIDAVGKEFDPTLHDAIMMEESEDYDKDTVVETYQTGYIMHNRVIRPAKVKVAKAVSAVKDSQNAEVEGNSEDNSEINSNEKSSEKGE
ncbi:MAG: nucleotide exchange factor GrpE [Spirochaetes bacterium]|nr:MAG: nucleotide exchange factor GrpE [Spirochaetota bacterium]